MQNTIVSLLELTFSTKYQLKESKVRLYTVLLYNSRSKCFIVSSKRIVSHTPAPPRCSWKRSREIVRGRPQTLPRGTQRDTSRPLSSSLWSSCRGWRWLWWCLETWCSCRLWEAIKRQKMKNKLKFPFQVNTSVFFHSFSSNDPILCPEMQRKCTVRNGNLH